MLAWNWSERNLHVFFDEMMLELYKLDKKVFDGFQWQFGQHVGLPSILFSRYGSNFITNFVLLKANLRTEGFYELEITYATTEQLNSQSVPDPWQTFTSTQCCQPEDVAGKLPAVLGFLLTGALPDGLRYHLR